MKIGQEILEKEAVSEGVGHEATKQSKYSGCQGMRNVWVWQACSNHIKEGYCSLIQSKECDRHHNHGYL